MRNIQATLAGSSFSTKNLYLGTISLQHQRWIILMSLNDSHLRSNVHNPTIVGIKRLFSIDTGRKYHQQLHIISSIMIREHRTINLRQIEIRERWTY